MHIQGTQSTPADKTFKGRAAASSVIRNVLLLNMTEERLGGQWEKGTEQLPMQWWLLSEGGRGVWYCLQGRKSGKNGLALNIGFKRSSRLYHNVPAGLLTRTSLLLRGQNPHPEGPI